MNMKLSKKFELTIPKAIRDQHGLHPGTLIEFSFNERGELVLRKADIAEGKT